MPSARSLLEDLVVIEAANVLAGPAVGMFFAELGATVIKVENIKDRRRHDPSLETAFGRPGRRRFRLFFLGELGQAVYRGRLFDTRRIRGTAGPGAARRRISAEFQIR